MKSFDYIDRIYCINLDRRPDRWEQCLKEFAKVGIEDRVFRISAIEKPDNPGYGNHLSHAFALRLAKDSQASNCLIFEDDVDWLSDPLVYLNPAWLELPEDWNIFYLGVNTERPCIQVSNHVAKLQHAFATHAYIVNSNMFDTLIELNQTCDKEPNDVRMTREIIPNYNCYTIVPLIAGQRDDYSDIMKRTMSSDSVFVSRLNDNLVRNRTTIKPTFVTFITPTLGRSTLPDTINSIINQTDWNWESIVVFDGKEPNFTWDNEHVRIMKTTKKGHAGAVRNEAFDYVDTDWTAFVDDDDTIHSDYVTTLKSYANKIPNADIFVFTYVDKSTGNTIPRKGSGQSLIYGNVGVSFAIKTSFLRKHNLYFPIKDCEDFQILDMAKDLGAIWYITHEHKYDVSRRGVWKE